MDYIAENPQTIAYGAGAAVVATVALRWLFDPLRRIPTVGGPSAPLLSYVGASNFIRDGTSIITEGYQKYYGSAFKVATLDRWIVIVSGPKMVEDLRKRPDDEVSFVEGAEEGLQTKHTIGTSWLNDPYHVDIIREKLTRTLPAVLPAIVDELMLAVPEHIPAASDEWVPVHTFKAMQKIVSRASNRVFVGLPVCRNEEFLDLAIKYTLDITSDRARMKKYPGFLKGVVGAFTSDARKTHRRAADILEPLITERLAKMQELGDEWTEKPNDMLTWILEQAIPRGSSTDQIVQRVLFVNFAAIHTSSNSVTHVLYSLAADPSLVAVLRAEVEPIVAAEGWSKAALGKMWKVDSLLRESQRVNGIGLLSITRKVLKDVTLPDGTFLPAGTLVHAALYPTHRESSVYGATADEFDPWRFARMREAAGEGTKHQYVNTSTDYLPFGHGRHACPGRFFAANELKALVAFLVLHYDMKIPGDGPRPSDVYFAEHVLPDPTARVLFRKRQPVRV
ncbi:cytochrome P450 [Epithele typhae]|uniref:cytochrome P450 n=1 Tax=Epithele typhae TaxID=378194 RepID=UPI002007C104|nr:cytochrome P450 [Epithele typhae]KAH9914911.1 cytochrome P450 [Epithele typhae]